MGGAQFAEVEVDTETGKVRVERVVAVHDCGLAVNALTTESQIQGGVIQGVSYALFEDRVLDPGSGRMLNPNVEEYKIAGSLDCPEIETIVLPVWEGVNNTQSTGIGEPATVPTAAAIANAVSHAIGAPITQLPITPEVVLAAVDGARRREAGHEAVHARPREVRSPRPPESRPSRTRSSRPGASTCSTA